MNCPFSVSFGNVQYCVSSCAVFYVAFGVQMLKPVAGTQCVSKCNVGEEVSGAACVVDLEMGQGIQTALVAVVGVAVVLLLVLVGCLCKKKRRTAGNKENINMI